MPFGVKVLLNTKPSAINQNTICNIYKIKV